MLPATREFLSIILEQESDNKSQKGKGNKKEPNKPQAGNDEEGDKSSEDDTSSIQILDAEVSNKLSLGKPINDNSLANMKYRSNASKEDAAQMLDDLGISAPSGKKWYTALSNLMTSAAGGEMSVFLSATSIRKSPNGKIGVLIPMKGIWKEDDKGGKRSFGFIRAVVMGARTAGFLGQLTSQQIKNLRIEQIAGTDSLIAYVGRSQSWRK
mgnify:FL=1